MLPPRFRNLLSERDGNVMVISALASLPLLGLSGIAVDYGIATKLQTKLQAATDATALGLCKTPLVTTQTALQLQAQTMMSGYMPAGSGLVVDPIQIIQNPRRILLKTRATSPAFFGKFTGTSNLTVASKAQCATPMPRDFEIALVLDNTGSMGRAGDDGVTKLTALQNAARSFVSSVFTNPAFGPGTKISIVPFASSVALNPDTYRNASWVDTAGKSTYHWWNVSDADKSGFTSRFGIFAKLKAAKSGFGWAGCFQSLPYPQNVSDTGVTSSNFNTLYIPHFAPDEPGNAGATSANGSYNSGNSYINDSTSSSGSCGPVSGTSSSNFLTAEARACKYASPQNPQMTSLGELGSNGPNFGCTTQPLQTLTNSTTTLNNLIDNMEAAGTTNIHEGFMWGWRTLSPNSVLGGSYTPVPSTVPSAYDNETVEKIIILMTDGANTWLANSYSPNKSYFSSFGYFTNANKNDSDALFPTTNKDIDDATEARTGIDALTATACSNAKATPAGITVFTIGFSTTNDPIDAAGQTLLTNCSGGPNGNPLGGKYIPANNATSLNAAFSQIASSIGSLRLTQ